MLLPDTSDMLGYCIVYVDASRIYQCEVCMTKCSIIKAPNGQRREYA